MKRLLWSAAVLAGLAIFGVACASPTPQVVKDAAATATSPAPDAKPVDITIAIGSEPRSLHPWEAPDAASQAVLRNVYEPLIETNVEGELKPLMAESWTIVDDVTYRFKLRQGIKFHDGKPLNADSVVASLNEIVLPASGKLYPAGEFTPNIEKVTKEDDLTFTIKTKIPYGPFLRNISMIPIVPSYKTREELAKEMVGTGPYQLKEHAEGARIVMEKFKDYWGPSPQVDRVTFRIVPENTARVAEGQAGRANIVTKVPPQFIPTIDGIPEMKVILGSTLYRMTVTYSTMADSPIKNPKVRQAINHAIDRKSIIENVLSGHGTEVGPLLPEDFGYSPNFQDYTYDPKKSKDLLAQAGYPSGFSVVLATPDGRYMKDKEISEAIAGMLREVGINARVQVYEWGTFLNKLNGKNLDPMFFVGWRGGNLDGSTALHGWDCHHPFSNYCNEQVQAAIVEGDSAIEPEKRIAAYQKALAAYLVDPAAAYLFREEAIYAVSKNLEWTPRADELILVKSISAN